VTIEDILLWIGGVEMPKGDPGKTRDAAKIWNQLAADLDASIKTAGPVAADVWAKNSGDAIDAFKKFWTDEFAPYPEEVAAYCKRVGGVCDNYAQILDDMRFAYLILAWVTWINMLITIAWGWVTGYAELAALRVAAWMRAQGIKRLYQVLVKILIEALIDSAAYAIVTQLGQVATFQVAEMITGRHYNDTMKQVFGFDPYSWGDNFGQGFQTFVANAAFDIAAEPVGALQKLGGAKGGKWAGFWGAHPRFGGFTKRMAASNVYTVVNNAYGDLFMGSDKSLLPTPNQEVQKVIFHGTRILKNPNKGPIRHPAKIPSIP
jgi:hypothetical protein